MDGLSYDGNSIWVFVLLTVILGGGAAALTGRAVASAWRPWWHVVGFVLLLGAAVPVRLLAEGRGRRQGLRVFLVTWAATATAEGANCRLDIWVPGDAPVRLDAQGVGDVALVKVPGGWQVTGCARGAYRVAVTR